MKKKKTIACILAATATLAIASMGTGCAVKDWFDEKINGKEESVLIPELYAYANGTKITSADIYADGVLSFELVANNYADATAEVVITSAPEGADASVEELDGNYTFYPDGVGEYVITITSVANEELTATITVSVKECSDYEEIFKGEYQNSDKAKDKQLYVLIAPEVSDGTYGQILISLNKTIYGLDGSVEEVVQQYCVYIYVYDKDSRMVELVAFSEAEAIEAGINEMYPGYTYSETVCTSLELTADYQLKIVCVNDMMTLVPYVAEEQTESVSEMSLDSESNF